MAKVKFVRQAYAVTLIVVGREVPAGTVVSLPQEEADRIATLFGTVPEDRSLSKLPEGSKSAGDKPTDPDKDQESNKTQTGGAAIPVNTEALKAELEAAQASYGLAKDALNDPNAGDEQLTAFEAAEERLNAAEAALEKAGGE